jgi:hypothetical protein
VDSWGLAAGDLSAVRRGRGGPGRGSGGGLPATGSATETLVSSIVTWNRRLLESRAVASARWLNASSWLPGTSRYRSYIWKGTRIPTRGSGRYSVAT